MKLMLIRKKRTVWVIDHAETSAAARKERIARGIGIREMSRRIGISAGHMSELDRGMRRWNNDLMFRYNEALCKTSSTEKS